MYSSFSHCQKDSGLRLYSIAVRINQLQLYGNRWLLQADYCMFSSVQSFSHVRLFVTPWTAAHQASLSIANSQIWLKLMSITLVMPSNHLILSCPLLLLFSVFLSIRVFSNESVLHIRWPASASVLPMNIQDWFPLGWIGWISLTLKSLLQYHSSKAAVLRRSAFFIVQLSHPYMTPGKNHTFDLTDLCWQSNVSAF